MTRRRTKDDQLTFLAGGGEMGGRIRAFDWASTPLGPVERWPQSLRSAVSILLPSKAQIVLFWGSELVTLYNDAYRPVFGAKHPDVLGMPARQAWSELWLEGLEALFEGVLATGEAYWASNRPFFLKRHGFLEETFFDVSYDPVRDESGKVGGIFCIVSETTGHVIGERRLLTLRELSARAAGVRSAREACQVAAATIAENAHDLAFGLLYLLDEDGRRATLAGWSGLQPGTPVSPASIDLHDPAAPWPFRRVAETGAAADVVDLSSGAQALPGGAWPEAPERAVVLPLKRPGQAPAGFLVAGASPRLPFTEEYKGFLDLLAGHVAAAVSNARSHEEQTKRSEALAELDRAKTAFFSNVSHEFRTPLTLMLGPVEDLLVKSHTDLSPAAAAQLEVVNRNGLRLLRLVNTLLDFSRIEAGRVRAAYQPTDLGAFTSELASVFRAAVERAGLTLTVDCPRLEEPVFVDRDMWEKVVLNLLSNALKFTFDGEIAVTVRKAGKSAELVVRDTGTGVAAAEIPRLFERFHRVANARGRTHEGSGIGLALVQELVRLHGGTIAAESALGRGTTFIIRVPLGSAHLPPDQVGGTRALDSSARGAGAFVEEALRWLPDHGQDDDLGSELPSRYEALPVPALPAAADSGDARARVLVADDNGDMRHYIGRLLAERYRVDTVADGEAALAAAREQPPDLVLTDVMMPRLDGFGLLQGLRADPRTREVPVILLSARAGEESRVEGMESGADDYLIKPFSARELLARVGAHLQMARMRREAGEALRDADRRKDEFLAMLSHELRGPLAPLGNMLEVVKRAGDNTELIQQAYGTMERQLAQLVRLVDDLLDVSRITRNKMELRKQRVELASIVHNAAEACRPLGDSMQHEVTVTLPPEPVYLDADPARLAQVFQNLLNNACKYTEAGGRVWLTAERQAGDVLVTIKDTGVGIPADKLASIFDMFTQVDASRERARGGLGIGLALVKRLVEMHDGTVEAKSEGPGRGSEFAVRLPLLTETLKAAGQATPAAKKRAAVARRVLVVDDNADSAESLSMLLQVSGHETHTAHDGLEAVAAAERFRPEVVLLDIGLPVLNGYDAARRIREQPWGKEMVLVALTGWGQEEDRRKSKDAGFDLHLVKPVDLEILMERLAALPAAPRP